MNETKYGLIFHVSCLQAHNSHEMSCHISCTEMKEAYSKTCVKWPLSKRHIGYLDQLSLNAGQKYCRMVCYHLSLRSLFCLFLRGRLVKICTLED